MTDLKRNRVINLYGDMRLAMNTLMLEKWRILGTYKLNESHTENLLYNIY